MLLRMSADSIKYNRVDRLLRKMRLHAEVHQRFIRIVADISVDILCQTYRIVQILRIFKLILVKLIQKREYFNLQLSLILRTECSEELLRQHADI
ncbi:hypothetical protein D3C80_1922020 [compost metagenome]